MSHGTPRLELDRADPFRAVERIREARRRGDEATADTLVAWLRDGVLDALPDAWTAWRAWGRLMELRGDARGELIALADQARTASGRAADRLVDAMSRIVVEHRRHWMGDELAQALQTQGRTAINIRWRHGFIGSAEVAGAHSLMDSGGQVRALSPTLDRLAVLFAAPGAELLRELEIRSESGWYTFEPHRIARWLAGEPRATLRRLHLGRGYDLVHTNAGYTVEMGPLLEALPGLDALFLGVREIAPEPFRHDRLRALELRTLDQAGDVLRAIGASRLPSLTQFTLGGERTSIEAIDAPNLRASIEGLEPLLQGITAPQLRELTLRQVACCDALVRRLPDSPLLAGLERLELRGGTLSPDTAAFIVAHQAAFAGTRLAIDAALLGDALGALKALPGVELV